ncbi:hypothetical protein LR48_Vigan11g010800 [Vigna angularis]|uniref:Uncharacterized protein n=1 Tax=Phaseolus angularis TaxID=3914 RepID=A0A0L9VPT4_PHAAN|nr:hypothetical protein LR48_Vigan11g010800 [Vigna angularis]
MLLVSTPCSNCVSSLHFHIEFVTHLPLPHKKGKITMMKIEAQGGEGRASQTDSEDLSQLL